MSYRSWLKDVKHMQDLGSHVYSTSQDWQTQEKRDQKYYALRENPVAGLNGNEKHFYGVHRGARILGVTRTDRDFSISIEDWWLPSFLEDISALARVDVPEFSVPLTFRFHDVAYQTALAARPDGVLRFFRYEKPSEYDLLYRDWFCTQDGRLQWIASLDVFGKVKGKMTVGSFLVVDCKTLSVDDEREETLRGAASPIVVELWREYSSFQNVGARADGPMSGPRAFAEFLELRGSSVSELFT